jgi:thioredoxin reductase
VTQLDVVVVGGGPAGRAAAQTARRVGARVALVDENGGDAVWDLWGRGTKTICMYRTGQGSSQLRSKVVVLAPGDRPRRVLFPGWTLPGVINLQDPPTAAVQATSGGVSARAGSRSSKGGRVVLAGAGRSLFLAARSLLLGGVRPFAIVDGAERSPLTTLAELMLRGMGVPWLFRQAIVEASGAERVESVHVRGAGSERRFDVDALYMDHGRVPATEIPFGIGAASAFEPWTGAFVATRDGRLRLSVPGVFLAGTAGGCAQGAAWAAAEGTLAGLWAAVEAGVVAETSVRTNVLSAERTIRRMRRARRSVFVPDPLASATPETIVCRCEGVRLSDLEAALMPDVIDPNWIKGPTNAAMGRCLGRDCEINVALAVARLRGRSASDSLPLNVRPPFRPVPLGAIARDIPQPERVQVIAGA